MKQYFKRSLSFCLALLMLTGMMTSMVLPVSAVGNAVNFLNLSNFQIIQRDANDKASVPIEIQYQGTETVVARVKATLGADAKKGASTDWVEMTAAENGKFSTAITLSAGGWYTITAQILRGEEVLEENSIEKIGVGDIYITYGQSNAASYGSPATEPKSDMVVAYNPLTSAWQIAKDPQPQDEGSHCGTAGSPWPTVGDYLVDRLGVPVGFISAAWGGAKVSALQPGTTAYDKMFIPMVKKFEPNGFKAVLYHQGETDTQKLTTTDDYVSELQKLIKNTRDDAGWNIPWMVANASIHVNTLPAAQNQTLIAQQKVIAADDNVYNGPYTDDMPNDTQYRHDKIHFNEIGLKIHGTRWGQAICSELFGMQEDRVELTIGANSLKKHKAVPFTAKAYNQDGSANQNAIEIITDRPNDVQVAITSSDTANGTISGTITNVGDITDVEHIRVYARVALTGATLPQGDSITGRVLSPVSVLPITAAKDKKLDAVIAGDNLQEYDTRADYSVACLLDGIKDDNMKIWHSKYKTTSAYVTFDLGEDVEVSLIKSFARINVPDTHINEYSVWVSNSAPTYSATTGAVPSYLDTAAPTVSGMLDKCTKTDLVRDIELPVGTHGRYVTVFIENTYHSNYLQIAEMEIYGQPRDVMKQKLDGITVYAENAVEYKTNNVAPYPATHLVDGKIHNNSNMWHTGDNITDAFITFDLGADTYVSELVSHARTNNAKTLARNIETYDIYLSNVAPQYSTSDGKVPTGFSAGLTISDGKMEQSTATKPYGTITLPKGAHGRYLTIHIKSVYDKQDRAAINIQEIEFFGAAIGAVAKLNNNDITLIGQNVADASGTFAAKEMLDGVTTNYNDNFWDTEEGTTDAYLTFDLGYSQKVSEMLLYARPHKNTWGRGVKDYEVWVSDTAPTYQDKNGTVPTGLADKPSAAGSIKLCSADFPYDTIQLNGDYGRYVTLHIKSTQTGAQVNIAEIEFFKNITGKLDSSKVSVLAHNAKDYSGTAAVCPPSAMLDGIKNVYNTNGFWGTEGGSKENVFVTFDLGSIQKISDMIVYARPNSATYNRCIKDYSVFLSNTAPTYTGTKGDTPTGIGKEVANGTLDTFGDNRLYDVINIANCAQGRYITIQIKNLQGGPTVDIAEVEFYTQQSLAEWAAHETKSLSIDYENATLIMPKMRDVSVSIFSSENESLISLDGKAEILYGGETNVVLRFTDVSGNVADTEPIAVDVFGLRRRMAAPVKLSKAWASNCGSTNPAIHLINGVAGGGSYSKKYWGTEKNVKEAELLLTLEQASEVLGISLQPNNYTNGYFPQDIEVLVSSDNDAFVSVMTKENIVATSDDAITFWFDVQQNVKYVKLICKSNKAYMQLYEVEVLGVPALQSAAQAAEKLVALQQDKQIVIKEINDQFVFEIAQSSNESVVAKDGTIVLPAEKTNVTLTIQVTNQFDATDVATVTRTVVVKTQDMLDVEKVAKETDLIPMPELNSSAITYPTVPAGYTIKIVESDHPEVVDTEGNINRSDDTTYRVRLTFEITHTESGATAQTKALLVPIYKTYVAPAMTEAEIAAKRADYEAKKYGVFVHYIPESDVIGHGTVYADGNIVQTTDELAENFDAERFAKDVHDFGMEYVVFTVWHYQGQAVFPSMTMQRWKDDRRSEGSTAYKTYAEHDLIEDLLDALEQYGIDLHLYNHPAGGVSYPAEDQKNVGWNDKTNDYATWNQYINELYYELGDRYGDRIKGLWMDGMFGHIPTGAPQERLRKTAEMFNPAMVMTMNAGFSEGKVDQYQQHTAPDYRCWEINRWVDYINDLKFSRHQVATCLAKQYWWTMVPSDYTFDIQPAEEMFQYLVALSSITTEGGLLASTGVYPVREGEELDSIWLNGMKEMFLELNSYLDPVAESVKNTSIGKAFPTTENITIADLEWGVSTESRDGKNIYLHVLKAPEGNTLALPETADGSELSKNAVIMNFDGSKTPITVTKTEGGYEIALPEGVNWSEVDTVIKAKRSGSGEAEINGKDYETFAQALADAKAGDTVVLCANAESNLVILDEAVTIDLNGYTLTADYVVGFAGSAVVDTSESNTGRLKTAKNMVALHKDNGKYLPVYDTQSGTYMFTSVEMREMIKTGDALLYQFSPQFETFVHTALAGGSEKSATKIVVQVSWQDETYQAKQSFVYIDDFVKEVIESYGTAGNGQSIKDYGKAFLAKIKRFDINVSDISIRSVIISDTGVEVASNGLPFTVMQEG